MSNAIARALLVRQELVDAAALEAAIAQLVVRETQRPEAPNDEEDVRSVAQEHRTQAAAPLARSMAFGAEALSRATGEAAASSDVSSEPNVPSKSGQREVRHVAIVTLKLNGIEELMAKDPILAQRTLDRLRTMLGDIAFKRNLRLWIWSSDS